MVRNNQLLKEKKQQEILGFGVKKKSRKLIRIAKKETLRLSEFASRKPFVVNFCLNFSVKKQ